jgi:acetylornithine/succinyldiaminopimelate/putrescine aminotransferase
MESISINCTPSRHSFTEYVNPVVGNLLGSLDLDKRFVRASGCFLWDEKESSSRSAQLTLLQGVKYLDFLAGYGTLPFGFNNKEIWSAIREVEEKEEPVFIIPSLLEVPLKCFQIHHFQRQLES